MLRGGYNLCLFAWPGPKWAPREQGRTHPTSSLYKYMGLSKEIQYKENKLLGKVDSVL